MTSMTTGGMTGMAMGVGMMGGMGAVTQPMGTNPVTAQQQAQAAAPAAPTAPAAAPAPEAPATPEAPETPAAPAAE